MKKTQEFRFALTAYSSYSVAIESKCLLKKDLWPTIFPVNLVSWKQTHKLKPKLNFLPYGEKRKKN